MTRTFTNKTLIIGLAVALVMGMVGWQLTRVDQGSEKSIQLPEANRQHQIDSRSHLYASNQKLPDLLTGFDIYFKVQGLRPDTSSPVFEYKSRAGKAQPIEECTEFMYLKEDSPAVSVTLIPADSSCFSQDTGLRSKVKNLQTRFQYVYAITQHLTD